ncbi:MAG: hypothetical protein HOQ45_10675 [Nocardioidaceae bacterium]|nr:hypothetical protein [Nocardioidaceae bacterium]
MVEVDWVVPDACTLPTVEQPLRVAEFDELFANHLQQVVWFGETRVRMTLAPAAGSEKRLPGLEARVRDLAARESACCSFFAFTVAAAEDKTVSLDVEVPSARVDVLAALTDRAAVVVAGAARDGL